MISDNTGLAMACTHSARTHSALAQKLSFLCASSRFPSASQLMEAKAGHARQLQDVDDAGATVENQLALVKKQLRAMLPELL